MPGARVPVIQREEDPVNKDKWRDQDEVRIKPGRLEQGDDRTAPKVQGRHCQPTDRHHRKETKSQQVCRLLIRLREHDRKLITHAGDDSDDAGDRDENRQKTEGLRAVEPRENGGSKDGDDLGEGSAADELEDVGGER